MDYSWNIIGVGSGWGASDMRTAKGPEVLLANCPKVFQSIPSVTSYWHENLSLSTKSNLPAKSKMNLHLSHLLKMLPWLSYSVENVVLSKNIPLVLGGDHSIAIGTWKGIKSAYPQEDIGLIWIDAHLDSHIPSTSPSLNFHGMPLAVLLGYGDSNLTNLKNSNPVIKPNHAFLIGARSYEEEEVFLLKNLGVKIYYMEEVKNRSFHVIFNEILSLLSGKKFGLSIDIDGFDPKDAPGTGVCVNHGLNLDEMAHSLYRIFYNPSFVGLEIVEYNPYKDMNNKTCHLIWNLISIISGY